MGKRDTDPRARAQDFKSFLRAAVHRQPQDLLPFSDWLREVTGNADDPRAWVVQHASANPYEHAGTTLYTNGVRHWEPGAPVSHATKLVKRPNGLTFIPLTTRSDRVLHEPPGEPTHAMITWKVPHPGSRNPHSDRNFQVPVTANGLHDFIDKLPAADQKAWRDHAVHHGLHDTRGQVAQGDDRDERPTKLAAIQPPGSAGGSVIVRVPTPTPVANKQPTPANSPPIPAQPKQSSSAPVFILPS